MEEKEPDDYGISLTESERQTFVLDVSSLAPDDRTLNCSLWRNGSQTELEVSRMAGDALEDLTEQQRVFVDGDRLDTLVDVGPNVTLLQIAAFDFGGSNTENGDALFFNPEEPAAVDPKPEMVLLCQSQRPPRLVLGDPTGPLTLLTGQDEFFSVFVEATTTPTRVVCRTSSTTPEITLGDIDLELSYADSTNATTCETYSNDWEEECRLDVPVGAETYMTVKIVPYNDMEGILLTCTAVPSLAGEVSAEYNVTAEMVPEAEPTDDDSIQLFDAGFGDDAVAVEEPDVSTNVTGEVDLDSILEGGPDLNATDELDTLIDDETLIEDTLSPGNNASAILDEVFDLLDDGNSSSTGVLDEGVDVLTENNTTSAPDESLNETMAEITSPPSDGAANVEEEETAATDTSGEGNEGSTEAEGNAAVSSAHQTLTQGGWIVIASAFVAASSFWL